ncbi:pheromone receptor [Artomyces pyxidatus]|uniref:Pheromone receptor n=1 Tax=Artomyces pyxidatus TaxID=48021 RepID=A0ACB8SYM6_9AGAM|nr:pheromone receptor [Artomyces pyxidatus]
MWINVLFSVFAVLGLVLSVIALYWHIEAFNVGICLFLVWTAVGCLILFINSVVWNGNMDNVAPIWCDIAVRLLFSLNVALPAASLCITRRLYIVTGTGLAVVNDSRELVIDLSIGVGIPVLEILCCYVVQSHRFIILEDIGCWLPVANNPPSYVLVYSWPIIISLVSGTLGLISLFRFVEGRREASRLVETDFGIRRDRYVRLATLACVDIVSTVPIALYVAITMATSPTFQPWTSWADVHRNFSYIEQIPATVWKADRETGTLLQLARWVYVCSGMVSFLVFGFTPEAVRHYRAVLEFVARPLRSVKCASPILFGQWSNG